MASTKGFSQWKKYYKGKGKIDLVLKKSVGLKTLDGKAGPNVSMGEVVTLLELKSDDEYYKYATTKTQNAIAWLPVEYKGKKYLCNIDVMSKPKETGGITDFKLQTSNLIKGGDTKKYDLMGYDDVECKVFTSATTLKNSCLKYIESNKLLDQNLNLKKSLVDYFKSSDHSKIKWNAGISENEIAQFKYLGEVAIGLVLLSKKTQSIKGNAPFKTSVKEIIFPIDESFAGADSFVKTSDGKIYPISSKLDIGAAASFWVNIFPKIMADRKYQTSTILKELCECAKNLGITNEKAIKTGAKKLVYEYGVRKLLKMTKTEMPSSYTLYEEFYKFDDFKKYSPPTQSAFLKLKKMMDTLNDETALKNLDSSTTVFFSKQIASSLNKDKKAIDDILTVLAQKSYYQANQNMKSLINGIVEFDVTVSGGATIDFIGTKSSYRNIEASQGTVNYILRKK